MANQEKTMESLAHTLTGRDDDESGRGSDTVFSLKIAMLLIVFVITLFGSYVPYICKPIFRKPRLLTATLGILTAFASGVVIGGCFSHLLPDAIESWEDYFAEAGPVGLASEDDVDYPFAELIMVLTCLFLVFVDKVLVSRGMHGHGHGHSHMAVGAHMPEHVHAPDASIAADIESEAVAQAIEMQPVHDHSEHSHSHGEHSHHSEHSHSHHSDCDEVTHCEDEDCSGSDSCDSEHCALDDDKCLVKCDDEECHAKCDDANCPDLESGGVPPTPSAGCETGEMHQLTGDCACNSDSDGETALSEVDNAQPETEKKVDTSRGSRAQIGRAWIFFVALSVHSIFDGLGVGTESDSGRFYALLAAVLIHKGLDGFVLGVAVYFASFRWWMALIAFVFCATMTPVGIGIGLAATSALSGVPLDIVKAIFLSMSAGSFLFIGLVELFPAAFEDGRLPFTKLTSLSLGWGIMALIALWV